MDAKLRKHLRQSCIACRYVILQINGKEPDQPNKHKGDIDNISKGGFRFITNIRYELEDRARVMIYFPDGYSQEATGRICYCNEVENSTAYAYGFSIIEGFIR
jgi:hypothetical protein